jgi:hypothetical protein
LTQALPVNLLREDYIMGIVEHKVKKEAREAVGVSKKDVREAKKDVRDAKKDVKKATRSVEKDVNKAKKILDD